MTSPVLQPSQVTMDQRIQALVTAAASYLVGHPEHLKVEVAAGINAVLVSIAGHRADTGSLMGKDCRHVDAVTQLVRFVAGNREVKVSIAEGHIGEKDKPQDIAMNPSWTGGDDNKLRHAVMVVTSRLFGPNDDVLVKVQSAGLDSIVTIYSLHSSPELQQAFHDIFRAWGRRHGRRVTVEMGKYDRKAA